MNSFIRCTLLLGVVMFAKGQNNSTSSNCTTINCPPATSCSMMSGVPECLPNNQPGNCSTTFCPPDTNCSMVNGLPECIPNNQTDPCDTTVCPPDTNCSMMSGFPECVPNNQTDDCSTVFCPPDTNCSMVGGLPECLPNNQTDDCSTIFCPPDTNCSMVSGFPECIPNNQTDNCRTTFCPPGTNCSMMSGFPECVPNNQTDDCSTVFCPPGTNCSMMSGVPECLPNNQTDDCSTMYCPPGTNCSMMSGFPECFPNNQTDDCSTTFCPPGTYCSMMSGMPECLPNNQTEDCTTLSCPGYMMCEMISGMPSCVSIMPPTCDTISCGSGMVCEMTGTSFMCVPSISGQCKMSTECPNGFYCDMSMCQNGTTTGCDGVCIQSDLSEGDICMSLNTTSTMRTDNSFLCKAGTQCRESSAGVFTCQKSSQVRCYPGSCKSNQICVVEEKKLKCVDIQKDPCDVCDVTEMCSISTTGVKCEKINECQELRSLQGMAPCMSETLCEIVSGTYAECKNSSVSPIEDKCAGRAPSSPDTAVAYCSTSGQCPPSFSCTGCASTCTCDIFTGKDVCTKVMCRPTCELKPVAIPCMELINRNMTASEREYCCREEKIGCDTYDCTENDMSESQKEFCCSMYPTWRWCGKVSEFDCMSEPSEWTYSQRKQCCENEGIGCPVGLHDCTIAADSVAFTDIAGGLTVAVDTQGTSSWTSEKKAYCCDLFQVGCTPTSEQALNCSNAENAPIWPESKRQECCSRKNIACEPKEPSTTDMGLLRACQVANFTSEGLRKKCCRMVGLGCKATKYNCFEGSSWSTKKRDWCCTRENSGCALDCTMPGMNATQKSECCELKGLQCPVTERPTGDISVGSTKFRLAMKGSKSEIELNPKQFLRGIRMALIAVSQSLLKNPKSLRITFVGWLKAVNSTFPGDDEIDNWGIPIPGHWNDENIDEEMGLMDILGNSSNSTINSREVYTLGVQSTETLTKSGVEGVFIEATSSDGSVAEISSAVTNKDPSLLDNGEGYKHLIQPVGEGMAVSTSPAPSNEGDDDSQAWIFILVGILGAICIGGAGFAAMKVKSPKEVSIGKFRDVEFDEELSTTF